MAWKELKDSIVGTATKVCGTIRGRRQAKRTKWWKEEVESAMQKNMLYRWLLDTCTVENRRKYSEAKLKARRLVRKAKKKEWMQFGKKLDKDARGNQPRFWARVNETG